VNKRAVMNIVKRFSHKINDFNQSHRQGDGGRGGKKRSKPPQSKSKSLKGGMNEQFRYAWEGALQDLKSKPLATFLTVMVIAISLTLPSVCFIVYKNVSQAAAQYYPSPQITVYLDKALDDDAAQRSTLP